MLLRLMDLSASLSVILLAQWSGMVVGIVDDASGAVVPTATVIVVNQGTGERASVITDGQGVSRFRFCPGALSSAFRSRLSASSKQLCPR